MKKMLLLCSALIMSLQMWAQLPQADVLDVVFNPDGTATDVSPMANEVVAMGSPQIKESPRWGMNVLCTAGTQLGGTQENSFKVMLTGQMMDAMKNGHTLECFLRPFWDGALNKSGWGGVLSFQQFGGSGLLLYNGQWCFEPHIGGGYVEAWGGQPQRSEWTHVVGVCDQTTHKMSIYINGELVDEVEKEGELKFPSQEELYIALAGDLSSGSNIEAGFPGDIAVARVYGKALTAEEVGALYANIASKDTGAEDHKEESRFANIRYDEEGTVLLATAEELNDYALLTKESPMTSARLEEDIDYSGYNNNICYYGQKFGGVFDGAGHTITLNLDFTDVETTGFIADAQSGAEVKDLTLEGNVKGNQRWTGVLFGSNYGAVARNIVIKANLQSDYAGASYGGVLSGWDANTCTYENIVIESTLSGCATYMGGLLGDVTGTTYLRNVLVVAHSGLNDPTQSSPLVASPRSGTRFDNVCFVNEEGLELAASGGTQLNFEDVGNGKACFLLNKEKVEDPTFYQNVGEDQLPSFDPTRGIVIRAGSSYLSITDDASTLPAAAEMVAEGETEYLDGVEIYEALRTQMQAQVENIRLATTREAFIEAYAAILEVRTQIQENIDVYDAYKALAESILPTLEGMTGDFALELRAYIEEESAPDDRFVNGTFEYIYNNKTLDTEGVRGEIAYMEEMQKKVSAADAQPGTDVTVLLSNADFSEGFGGWDGDDLTGYGTNGNTWAAENWGRNGFDIYQEITGVKNGVYAFRLRGAYRPFNEITANQYWPYIYANGNINYLQNSREDMIGVEEAVDHENCYITAGVDNVLDYELYDDGGNVVGYAPQGVQGSCYAFQAGRYANYILVNVTDGTLRVGVNHTYSAFGGGNEWVGLGDAMLTYCGTVEEAAEYVDQTLQGMLQRAATLLAYQWSDGEDHAWYPNFSQALKDRMAEIIAAYPQGSEATAADKYARIEELSAIFAQIKECKLAYRKLAQTIINVFDRVVDYPDNQEEILTACDQAWELWRVGAFATAEEAQAKCDELNNMMDGFELTIPEPDVLDIVFNADGTATDKSPMQNELVPRGELHVVESPVMQQNVLCLGNNDWGKTPSGYYELSVTEELQNAMADGITMECMVRPTWEGDGPVPTSWASFVGYEEAGGLGMMVYNSKWMFEAHVGGGYRDAIAETPVVKDEWVHFVGVWNKEEGNIYLYMNGEFAGSARAEGELKMPNADRQWMGIGADLPGNGKDGQAAFRGDIAIVRLYNEPLNGSQASKLYRNAKETMAAGTEHDCSETTAIDNVREDVAAARKGVFNLMGQKVSRMQKGIYIIDGKKVMVK